jgi:hypothetical protein
MVQAKEMQNNIRCRIPEETSTFDRWLVAGTAATATATATAAGESAGGSGGTARGGGSENGKLDGCSFAGTLGTGDFLLLVDDDFFKVFVAVFADVFVDRHWF